jgi:dCMP deaminase
MERLTWEEYFMNVAVTTALRSNDPSTRVGCVIVDEDNTIVTTGYNAFPRGSGFDFDKSVWENKESKYMYIVHAEANAIYNATRQGKSLNNCTVYITFHPCHECAKALIQVGIKEIVYLDLEYYGLMHESWKGSFEKSEDILSRGNISTRPFHLTNQIKLMLNGEVHELH